MSSKRNHQAGMSLIEVLTALLIFSLGILGLMSLQTRAMQISTGAEDTNRAALLANEIATAMLTTKDLNAPTALWKQKVADPTNGGLPRGEGEVVVTGDVAEITVKWRATSSKVATDKNQFVTQVTIPKVGP